MAGRKREGYRRPPPLAWGTVPLVPLAGAVMLGIGLAYLLEYRYGPYLLASTLAPALAALLLQLRGGVGYGPGRLVSGLLVVTLVFFAAWRATDAYLPNDPDFFIQHYTAGDLLSGTVTHTKRGEKRTQLWINLEGRVKDTNTLHRVVGKIIVFAKPGQETVAIRVGDQLVLRADVRPAPRALNPEAFDYGAYLAAHNIFHLAYANGPEDYRILPRVATGVRETAAGYRRQWETILATYLDGDELAVASALVLGKRDELSEEIRTAYADTGAVHILAVSGLHVGIVTAIFFWLFRALLPRRRWADGLRTVATIAVVWAFAFVTGLSPSVQRSALMFSILVAGGLGYRRVATMNLLAMTAALMLLWEPGQLFQVGFQLSFAAVTGIVWFTGYLTRLLPDTGRAHGLIGRIWGTLAASVGAQLGTFPLAAMYFRQFPAYFLVSGTVVVLTAFLVLSLGIALAFVVVVFGPNPVASLLGELLGGVLSVQNGMVRFFQSLARARVEIGGMNWWVVVGYVALIGVMAVFVRWRRPLYAFMALGLLFILGPLRTLERRLFPAPDELVIYHVYGHSVADVFSRGGVYTLPFRTDSLRVVRATAAYRQARRVTSVTSLLEDRGSATNLPQYRPPFLLTDFGVVLILSQDIDGGQLDQLPPLALVWLRGEPAPATVAALKKLQDVPMVADGSNRSFYLERLRAAGISVYATGERGAYRRKTPTQ